MNETVRIYSSFSHLITTSNQFATRRKCRCRSQCLQARRGLSMNWIKSGEMTHVVPHHFQKVTNFVRVLFLFNFGVSDCYFCTPPIPGFFKGDFMLLHCYKIWFFYELWYIWRILLGHVIKSCCEFSIDDSHYIADNFNHKSNESVLSNW